LRDDHRHTFADEPDAINCNHRPLWDLSGGYDPVWNDWPDFPGEIGSGKGQANAGQRLGRLEIDVFYNGVSVRGPQYGDMQHPRHLEIINVATPPRDQL
jgi:hypothetical protein